MRLRDFSCIERESVFRRARKFRTTGSVPCLRLVAISALVALLTETAAHADAPPGGYPRAPYERTLSGAALAFLLLLLGSFIFIVRPPRKP